MPTYPSTKPTLTLTSRLGQNADLAGDGVDRQSVSPFFPSILFLPPVEYQGNETSASREHKLYQQMRLT